MTVRIGNGYGRKVGLVDVGLELWRGIWEEFGEMMKRVWRFVFEGEKVGDRGEIKLERFGIVMVSVWEGNWCFGLGFI